MQTLYLSRLLSGMVSVAVGGAAIALAGTFGPWLFAMLLLPMSLSLMAAVSQDGLMFSLAAPSAAIMARAMIERRGGGVGSDPGPPFRLLVLCLALIGMARPPYAPWRCWCWRSQAPLRDSHCGRGEGRGLDGPVAPLAQRRRNGPWPGPTSSPTRRPDRLSS